LPLPSHFKPFGPVGCLVCYWCGGKAPLLAAGNLLRGKGAGPRKLANLPLGLNSSASL